MIIVQNVLVSRGLWSFSYLFVFWFQLKARSVSFLMSSKWSCLVVFRCIQMLQLCHRMSVLSSQSNVRWWFLTILPFSVNQNQQRREKRLKWLFRALKSSVLSCQYNWNSIWTPGDDPLVPTESRSVFSLLWTRQHILYCYYSMWKHVFTDFFSIGSSIHNVTSGLLHKLWHVSVIAVMATPLSCSRLESILLS